MQRFIMISHSYFEGLRPKTKPYITLADCYMEEKLQLNIKFLLQLYILLQIPKLTNSRATIKQKLLQTIMKYDLNFKGRKRPRLMS